MQSERFRLLVSNTRDRIVPWNRQELLKSLKVEAVLDDDTALTIVKEVEQQLQRMRLRTIKTSLIRDCVTVALAKQGLETPYKRYKKLGVSFYEMLNAYLPKGVVPGGRVGDYTSRLLIDRAKKEFALDHIYPEEVMLAHLQGEIHIHGLEHVDSLYSTTQSLELVKKFGLDLHNRMPFSPPARESEDMISQLAKFTHGLQGHFHGPVGWDGVNIYLSTFLEHLPESKVSALAQMLVYEMSQQDYAANGAEACDFHLYWEIPRHLQEVIGISKAGKRAKKTYHEYSIESQRLLWSMVEVFRRGDALRQPFFNPRPVLHITEQFFKTPGSDEFLRLLGKVAFRRGTMNFVFDRGGKMLVNRYGQVDLGADEGFLEATEPWKMRYHGLQNVVLNLVRVSFRARKDPKQIVQEIQRLLEIAVQAHLAKKSFIFRLLNRGSEGPLGLLTRKFDDRTFLRADRLVYLVSFVGLNELVQSVFGKQLHEEEKAITIARNILGEMQAICQKLSAQHKIKIILDNVPTEEAKYRFADLDLSAYPEMAQPLVKGEPVAGVPHYTDSAKVAPEAEISAKRRIAIEGMLHPSITGGGETTIWLRETRPNSALMTDLIRYAFFETTCQQLTFAPDFTRCFSCNGVFEGLLQSCPNKECRSSKVDGITKQSGNYAWVSHIERENMFDLLQRYHHPELSDGEGEG